jgi:hypothetical protein
MGWAQFLNPQPVTYYLILLFFLIPFSLVYVLNFSLAVIPAKAGIQVNNFTAQQRPK